MQIYFTDKTASQLKSSDGMRLIRNTKVVDSITQYWQGVSDLKFTYENYENYRRPLRQLSFKIFNYTNYKKGNIKKAEFTINNPQLITKDAALLKEFRSEVWLVGSNIERFYLPAIGKQRTRSDNLIHLIKTEYSLQ
jgi:hypothetical protein